ncbi:MAG: threonine-phosphate decarboxylase, partial [Mesorhizobium sp.]
TTLYRFLRLPNAADLFSALGGRGILLRHFSDRPSVLRAGLPGRQEEWQRLESALAEWASRREDQSKGSKQ